MYKHCQETCVNGHTEKAKGRQDRGQEVGMAGEGAVGDGN